MSVHVTSYVHLSDLSNIDTYLIQGSLEGKLRTYGHMSPVMARRSKRQKESTIQPIKNKPGCCREEKILREMLCFASSCGCCEQVGSVKRLLRREHVVKSRSHVVGGAVGNLTLQKNGNGGFEEGMHFAGQAHGFHLGG